MAISNDSPIDSPDADLYSLNPFAKAVAKAIEGSSAPNGLVFAINGPWGSGKSSAINLIRHHLSDAIDNGDIVVITFSPWWFPGVDAITLAFFQELGTAIGRSLPEQVRRSLARVGGNISAVGTVVGAAANIKLPGAGGVISSATGWLGNILQAKRTVEQEYKIVTNALANQKKRFLVVIDDIDRLAPDDALTIFRLVKSVGRLPNVIYLLSFDKTLAGKAVADRFPSEGIRYLEKIVQNSFDIPPPLADVLREQILVNAEKVMGDVPEAKATRFMNVFFDVVAPLIHTPRDVVRLDNDLQATWPAIANEVDRADFLALSAIKLASPSLYDAIRARPSELCDTSQEVTTRHPDLQKRYDLMLGLNHEDDNYLSVRRSMMRLFPRLESVWSNVRRGGASEAERRICSEKYFQTYFSLSLSSDVLPMNEINDLIHRADETSFVKDYLRGCLQRKRRDGSTQGALILDEITTRAAEFDIEKIPNLVIAIFSIADELDVEADRKGAFAIGDNSLRIHWLVNRLVTERFEGKNRDDLYLSAIEGASLKWCCDFARRCLRHCEPAKPDKDELEPIVSSMIAKKMKGVAIARLREAAADPDGLHYEALSTLLFLWSSWTSVGEVRNWTDKALDNDSFVVVMAKRTTSTSWSQGLGIGDLGDRVAKSNTKIDLKPFEKLVDISRLEIRVQEVAKRSDLEIEQQRAIQVFVKSPKGGHNPMEVDEHG